MNIRHGSNTRMAVRKRDDHDKVTITHAAINKSECGKKNYSYILRTIVKTSIN